MKRVTLPGLLLFVSLLFAADILPQSRDNNSLLWRISGNGLAAPSYLFGTMHVYDKKAFNFKDSLYIFLEQAEGFALEFDPDSANGVIEAYMNGSIKTDNEEKQMPDISSSDLKLMQKKMGGEKSFYLKEDKKSMIDYFITRLLASDKKQKNSMNTFMDAFLYEIAKQYDKKMYGLEELNSQIATLNSLSKGMKIKKFVSLLDKWDPEKGSPVTELYFNENIDSLNAFFTTYFSEETLDVFLYKRNKVMATKMDSLMRLQSMFTAVGAAHLGGDKGIITLLRQKGYTVEPIFSSQRILASEYNMKKKERPAYVIKNEERGIEYEMPGKPNIQEGEAGKSVEYYYDLGGGLLYMTICGKLTYEESKKKPEEIATAELDNMVLKVDGKILSSKIITAQGLKGMEILCLGRGNNYYRLYDLVSKNMSYVFSLTAQKKDNLYSEKAEKYIASFKLIPIPPTQWNSYEFADDGFKISFPGHPGIKPLKTEDQNNISINSYSFFDANTGVNYSISTSKTTATNEYTNNESLFEGYLEQIRSGIIKGLPSITDTTVDGFAGKKFTRPSETNSWKGFLIMRDHLCYFVVAEFEPGRGDEQAQKFLDSFLLINYRQPAWQLKNSPSGDFLSWVPSDIQQKKYDIQEIENKSSLKKYYSYDPYSGVTYTIDADTINQYYWAPNKNSIYNYLKDKFINEYSDSLIRDSVIKNGGITGRQFEYANKYDHKTRKLRLLVNGRMVYSFYTTEPAAFADKINTDLFFTNFKLTEEKEPDEILHNSPAKFFADLHSGDSLVFQNAYDALNSVKFSQEDLMQLLEKSLLDYPVWEDHSQSVNKRLLTIAGNLFENADTLLKKQVSHFIEENYAKPGKVAEDIRFPLLEILSRDKLSQSYTLIKELFAKKLPSKGSEYLLFSHLSDSLSLTKTLYPELLKYISDTTMGMAIITLIKEMVDSNVLQIDSVLPGKTEILKLARTQLKYALKAKTEDDIYDYRISDLLSLMGMMKQKEMDELLMAFLRSKPLSIKEYASMALIKNNKPIAPNILNLIAADNYERINLYNDLKKINKVVLFPSEFRSQQKLAESYIYHSIVEEDDGEPTDVQLIYIKKIEYEYKGEKKRFFFFKATFPGTGDSTEMEMGEVKPDSYIAISGPFDIDATKTDIEEEKNITSLYYEKKFDGMMMDDYFKKFIEERSKYQ